jgi:mannose PTS system EIIA component
MIAVLVICHEPLATALISCTRHVFRSTQFQLAALDVMPSENQVQALQAARDLISRISDGSGVLVLTDLFGATPSLVARQLFEPHRISIVNGVNLPMLMKALSLRRTPMPVTDLVDAMLDEGRKAMFEILPENLSVQNQQKNAG